MNRDKLKLEDVSALVAKVKDHAKFISTISISVEEIEGFELRGAKGFSLEIAFHEPEKDK